MSASAMPHPLSDLPFHLRTFSFPEDYDAVVDLWQHAGPGVHVGRSDTRGEIAKKLERDPDLFLVAELVHQPPEAVNKIVGAVLGGFDGRRGLMYHLAVSAEYRNRGVGKAMVDELERRLAAKGCLKYYLLVTIDNLEAQAFYEKHGWERMPLHIYGKDIDR